MWLDAAAWLSNIIHTVAILPIRQEGRDDDDPSLANTHAQKAFVHALDEVPLPQVGVVRRVPRVTKAQRSEVCSYGHTTLRPLWSLLSPGVKGSAGQQGAVIVVPDEVRRCGSPAAGGRFADRADLDFVLVVPYIQQENVVHQHSIRRDCTAWHRRDRRQ